ncbi:GNAT family N-acetyltransferase [Paenalkalicoccus suaedae]|uniref:GNAT family N-acetyltransferase n=1 Tax=Paenalkalicoccus suaedae TaxID=2592382 RepID=A0A859FK22_9BACI|nr:GNAT family N-acetyltransferase [Paenalkalicoccus suaedae]QKS73148.1 GNAT family N-acetyltransferase [Paenalkalicoccus suaedae]
MTKVDRDDRERLVPLLVEADESELIVREYLHEGDLFEVVNPNEQVIGVALVVPTENPDTKEIKNIALTPDARGHGYGRRMIDYLCEHYAPAGVAQMLVGTANSSIDNLIFYQKVGFRMHAIKHGFFDAYPEPIVEHGIQARDMVMLVRDI